MAHREAYSETQLKLSYSLKNVQVCYLTDLRTDFLSDIIPSKIQVGIDDTDAIPILCTKTTVLLYLKL